MRTGYSVRGISSATYRDIGVRYVASNTHPDHDTICAFRRKNFEAVAETFEQVLLLAKELKLLRVGMVSVDGTKVDANANKRNSIRYDRAQALPEELARREQLKSKLDEACAELERRAGTAADAGRAEHDRKVASRERRRGRRKGPRIKPPREEPEEGQQINLTDGDSALMRKSKRHEYRQAYNAQAVVDAEGSQLVLGISGQLNPEPPPVCLDEECRRDHRKGRLGTGRIAQLNITNMLLRMQH